MGRPSLCGTSQLGWCVPGRLWDDPPLSHPTFAWDIPDIWDVPRDVGRPTWLGCPSSAGLSQFGWAVPVWLGCPSCGPSHLGAGCPFSRWVIPALHGTSHAAGLSQFGCELSQFGWGVPVWLGCPSCGHPTLKRAVPRHWSVPVPLGTSYGWAVPVRVGCPEFCWVVPVFTGSSRTQLELLKPYVKGHSLLTC